MQDAPADRHGPSLAKLRRLANAQKFDELETAWVEAIGEGVVDPGALLPIAGQVDRLGEPDKAVALLWFLLHNLEEKEGPAAALRAARRAASELPNAAALRDELMRLYDAVHPEYAELHDLVDSTFASQLSLPDAVATVDRYLALQPGAFLRSASHLEPGVVESVNSRTGVVVARFGQRHHDFQRDQMLQLTVLPPDHFRALMLYEPDRLRALATGQPVEFVCSALSGARGQTLAYRELKAQIAGLLGDGAWAGWWASARAALRRDPRLEVSAGSQPTFRLLAQARTYEERLRDEFAALPEPLAKLGLVLDYLEETDGKSEADPDLLAHFGHAAARLAVAALPAEPAIALAGLAAHAAIAARGVAVPRPAGNAAVQVVSKLGDPSQLPRQLDDGLLRLALDYLRAELPDAWPSLWGAILPRVGRRLCEQMARELVEAGQTAALEAALAEVVARPTAAPDALCWLWRARRGGKLAPVLGGMASLSGLEVLSALLNLADATGKLCSVSDEDRHHKVLAQVQQALAGQGGLPAREIIAAATPSAARRLKELIEDNSGLPAATRGELLGYVRAGHPALLVDRSKPWQEDVIYTTAAGLEQRRSEFERLVKQELPAVAKQIGEAASHGDLSENSEYTAALERRDQITSRAAAIEGELARARMISPDMAASGYVNVGTRIRARMLPEGREEDYTFLGPWDANPEEHILTYNAPLALAFMGRKPGETVVYGEPPEERRWELLSVEPAI